MAQPVNVVHQALAVAVAEEKMAENLLPPPPALPALGPPPAQLLSLVQSPGSADESPEKAGKEGEQKAKRRKVTKACLYCQKSHMSCDKERPCKRCLARNIGHLCRDLEGKRRGRRGAYLSEGGRTSFGSPPKGLIPYSDEGALTLQKLGGEQHLQPEPEGATDLLFASLEEMTVYLYALERSQAVEDDKAEKPQEVGKAYDALQRSVQFLFYKWLGERVGPTEDLVGLRKELEQLKRKQLSGPRAATAEEIEASKQEFHSALKMYRDFYQQVDMPALVWERNWRVHYANKAFCDLTGFAASVLPTPENDASFLRFLSPNSIVQYLKAIASLLKNSLTFVNFPCSIPNLHGGPTFTEGTFCMTVRRDPVGLPLLFLGTWLPFVPPLGPLILPPSGGSAPTTPLK